MTAFFSALSVRSQVFIAGTITAGQLVDGWVDEWVDGWERGTEGGSEGRTDGQMGEQMDG